MPSDFPTLTTLDAFQDTFLNATHIRIHNRELCETFLDDFRNALEHCKVPYAVFSVENPGSLTEHLHAMVPGLPDDLKVVEFVNWLKEKKIIQGRGNKFFSLSKSRSSVQLVKYISKECDETCCRHIDQALLKQLAKGSFKKGSAEFATKLGEIEANYFAGRYDEITRNNTHEDFYAPIQDLTKPEQFMIYDVIKLKLEYGHSILQRPLKDYILKMRLKKHGHYAIINFIKNNLSDDI